MHFPKNINPAIENLPPQNSSLLLGPFFAVCNTISSQRWCKYWNLIYDLQIPPGCFIGHTVRKIFIELHVNKTLMKTVITRIPLYPAIMTFSVRHFLCLYISTAIFTLVNPGTAIGVDVSTGFIACVTRDGV